MTDVEETSAKKPVTVYKTNNCIQCVMTMKEMDKLGIKYETINMTDNEDEKLKIKKMGYMMSPVVIVDEDTHWAGFKQDKIKWLAEVN